MEYVAGSHRWGQWFRPKRFVDAGDHPAEDPRFLPMPDVEAKRGEYRILGWDLEPGDCIVFHALTLHGAPGNRMQNARRAFAARWTGDDAVFVRRKGLESPPPPPDAPAEGRPMDSAVFPVVRAG